MSPTKYEDCDAVFTVSMLDCQKLAIYLVERLGLTKQELRQFSDSLEADINSLITQVDTNIPFSRMYKQASTDLTELRKLIPYAKD